MITLTLKRGPDWPAIVNNDAARRFQCVVHCAVEDKALISALVGHLVGDYLTQNDWMALNKKASSFHCAVHCSIWTICVLGALAIAGEAWPLWTALPLFVTHFLQDRTQIINRYMVAVGQSKFAQPPMSPWSTIVVDNVWHIVTIWVVWLFVR